MDAIHLKKNQQVFLAGYANVVVKRAGVMTCVFPQLGAHFEVAKNLAPLFPYINSSIEGAQYFAQPERIQCIFAEVQCTLYSHAIIAAGFNNHEQARIFGEKLLHFLNELFAKRNSLTPNHRQVKNLSALDIYKILPQTNCAQCGLPSCLAFASALSKGKGASSQCPDFAQPMEKKAVYQIVGSEGELTSTIELDLPEQELPPPQSK
ncbi:(Fe-S)-binding protein, partial [Thermodesulfobacteriota bacterium]